MDDKGYKLLEHHTETFIIFHNFAKFVNFAILFKNRTDKMDGNFGSQLLHNM